MIVALDTDVVVAALRSPRSASRRLIQDLRGGRVKAVATIGMFIEYQAVPTRPDNLAAAALTTSNYALRLQKSLLEEVKRIAAEENTTINQFINVAVAEKAPALRTEAANAWGAPISPNSIPSLRRLGSSRHALTTRCRKIRLESPESARLRVLAPTSRWLAGTCRLRPEVLRKRIGVLRYPVRERANRRSGFPETYFEAKPDSTTRRRLIWTPGVALSVLDRAEVRLAPRMSRLH